MITLNETLISFEEAAKLCKVTWKTIWCWSKRLDRPLESVKIGGQRRTSKEAIQRFMRQDGQVGSAAVLPNPTRPIDDSAAILELMALQ